MSIRLMTRVWAESPYSDTKLLVHLALADISHDDGRFFASQKMLAERARCTPDYIRKIIREMVDDGFIKVVSRGTSKGNATVYQLLWATPKPPETLWESKIEPDMELPENVGDNSHTPEGQLPYTTAHHPSYTSVLSTTKEETANAVSAESIAKLWWEKQTIKPIGKGAWHSLIQVCDAALKRGYSQQAIIEALDYIKTVPSMRQMDLVLRKVGVHTRSEQSASRALEISKAFERMELS